MMQHIICRNCGKKTFYTLKDGTRVCRTCGNRWKDFVGSD